MRFHTEVSTMKRELTSASQAFGQLGASEMLQADLKAGMRIVRDNDSATKSRILTVEADPWGLYDRTVKALTEGIEHKLRQHSQEAISDVARCVQLIEFGEEINRALAKSSEFDLRVADVEPTIVRIESALNSARGEHDKAIFAAKTRLMQIID